MTGCAKYRNKQKNIGINRLVKKQNNEFKLSDCLDGNRQNMCDWLNKLNLCDWLCLHACHAWPNAEMATLVTDCR